MKIRPTIHALWVCAAMLLSASWVWSEGTENRDQLTATGKGSTVTINATDLVGAAGSALKTTKDNVAGAITVSIVEEVEDTGTWAVNARRSVSANWPVALTVGVKRTGDGTGLGTISGGNTGFQTITAIDAPLFTGTRSRSGIPLQVELSGLSLQVPPDTYTATITFTMYDAS